MRIEKILFAIMTFAVLGYSAVRNGANYPEFCNAIVKTVYNDNNGVLLILLQDKDNVNDNRWLFMQASVTGTPTTDGVKYVTASALTALANAAVVTAVYSSVTNPYYFNYNGAAIGTTNSVRAFYITQ
jgi:hypothetical protein